jgi:hypothetical protein
MAECRVDRLPRFRFAQAIGNGTRQQTFLGVGVGLAGIADLAGGIEKIGIAPTLGCAALKIIKSAFRQRRGDR